MWLYECCVGNTEPSYRPMSFPEPTFVNVDTTCILWSHGHIYIYKHVCVCCNCPLPKVGPIFVQQGGEVFWFWSFSPWRLAHCGQNRVILRIDLGQFRFVDEVWTSCPTFSSTVNTGNRTCSAEKSDGFEGAHNLIKKYTKLFLSERPSCVCRRHPLIHPAAGGNRKATPCDTWYRIKLAPPPHLGPVRTWIWHLWLDKIDQHLLGKYLV